MNYSLLKLLKYFFQRIVLLIVLLTFAVPLSGQTFNIQGKHYQKVEGKWYNTFEGKIGDPIILDRLVVRLRGRENVKTFDFSKLNLKGIDVISDSSFGGFYTLRISSSLDPFLVAEKLESSLYFDYIRFDALGKLYSTPNDQYYPNQWNMSKISMESAWDITTGSSTIPMAIIDSGTDYYHNDLDGNLWQNTAEVNGQAGVDDDNNGYVDDYHGWDFYENDNAPIDPLGHGTAVAGIAGAQTNNYEGGNYLGIAGIAGGWNNALSNLMIKSLIIITSIHSINYG